MFLSRSCVTSNASRKLLRFTSKWYDRSIPKKLSYRKVSRAGRSSHTGRVVVWTKSSILRRVKLQSINYSFRSKAVGFISTLRLTPRSNKLLALATFANGEQSYFPAIESTSVFRLVGLRYRSNTPRAVRAAARWSLHYSLIFLAPMFRKVSNLELRPGAGVQYARSAGSSAKIIKLDKSKHVALVKLPSGVRKFFSVYGLTALGPAALKLKRKLANTKSGFWRSFGLKPKVRGVARNPVDHPHGGRTKAIKYPRTPWGKTTKFK